MVLSRFINNLQVLGMESWGVLNAANSNNMGKCQFRFIFLVFIKNYSCNSGGKVIEHFGIQITTGDAFSEDEVKDEDQCLLW